MTSFQKIPAKNKQGYKWKCIMDGPPDPVTGKRRQVPRIAETKKEAEARAQAVIAAMNSGIDTKKRKNVTFREAADQWMAQYRKTGVGKSTIENREKLLNTILKYFDQINISRITREQYQDVVNRMFDSEEYSRSHLNALHVVMGLIFDWAVIHKLCTESPAKGIKLPRKQITVAEIEADTIQEKYFEHEELIEFLQAAEKYGKFGDKEMFYLLAHSGIRAGEMCALGWSDLLESKGELRITKTLYVPRNNIADAEVSPPKTPKSVRNVPLDESIISMLKLFREAQKERHKLYKQHHDDFVETPYMFTRENGHPMGQNMLGYRMRMIMRHTNIKKHATPHIFRHTYISILTESKVDLPTIMHLVGHANSNTTLATYTHITNKMMESASEKSKVHFKTILEPLNRPD